MAQINISNLSFTYDGSYDPIFENVSFQIDTDWKLGFTGRNGRGKTTFFHLLMGKFPYQGKITSPVTFEYFPYPVQDPDRTTYEILQEICDDFPYWKLIRELNLLGIQEETLYRPFSTLSSGERTKALLAVMFLKENSFLLIDEPTNHLDQKGREVVSRYLNSKQGFILVSHDRAFLDGCVDHILSINRANIEIQKGNFSSWMANKDLQDQFERSENERLKKEIKRLRETAREKADWSDQAERRKIGDAEKHEMKFGWAPKQGAKAKKMMSRAKAIESRQQNVIEEKESMLHNIENKEDLKISQLAFHSSRLLLLKDVSIRYDGHPVCGPLSFTVEKGDRIAICGRNGSGKSSLIKLICGQDIPYTGELQKNGQLKISYVSQDAGHLNGTVSQYADECRIDESLFLTILRKLDFSRAQFEKDMRDFSGGQKKKVLIARSLCEQAHLHIWDEPMNYIDVISRIQIEELLLKFQPTILFVEHDRAFQEKIATKRIEL